MIYLINFEIGRCVVVNDSSVANILEHLGYKRVSVREYLEFKARPNGVR